MASKRPTWILVPGVAWKWCLWRFGEEIVGKSELVESVRIAISNRAQWPRQAASMGEAARLVCRSLPNAPHHRDEWVRGRATGRMWEAVCDTLAGVAIRTLSTDTYVIPLAWERDLRDALGEQNWMRVEFADQLKSYLATPRLTHATLQAWLAWGGNSELGRLLSNYVAACGEPPYRFRIQPDRMCRLIWWDGDEDSADESWIDVPVGE